MENYSALSANKSIGASPESGRGSIIASRNRRLADLMSDPFFESELRSLRLSLIEKRENLLHAYGKAAGADLRTTILVLLNNTDSFLKLLSIEGRSVGEGSTQALKREGRATVGQSHFPREGNAPGHGNAGARIVKDNPAGQGGAEVVKSDTGIAIPALRRAHRTYIERFMYMHNI